MKIFALLLPILALAAAPARAEDPATDDRPAPPAPIDESVSSEELCRRANDGDMYAFQALRTRAFKGDDEAMSLYFWKTDDWWRGSSFFPVTIRSVEPETGQDANAATNWIVELLGGIKVRTADPAAAFGAPPGSLPGRRLGVRFRDYKGGWRLDGMPSAMSNACVYAGAIEVRPLLPASEREAAREIIDRNLDDLTRLTDAGREELERRIGKCWVDWGSGISFPTWFFEEGVSFTLTDGYPTDPDFGKAVCEDETPAVTVDGEVVATRGEVAREAIRVRRPTALVAAAFADDFLLEREAKKNGFATAWAFVHEGLDPPTDPDARAFWNGLREDYPNAPSDDARKRFLLLDWQTRFAERRDKLLVALREAATIQYAATAVYDPATNAPAPRAESAEGAAETISRRRAVVLDGVSRRWKGEPGTTASRPPAWAAQPNGGRFTWRLVPASRREGPETEFKVEAWCFNGGSTNAALRDALSFLVDDEDEGLTILSGPATDIVIRAISNETATVSEASGRVRPLLARIDPQRFRAGDRIDLRSDEFDLAVSAVPRPNAIDLVFRRNASSAPSLEDFPEARDPDSETTVSIYSGSTVCLFSPSRVEGGFPALLLVRVTMLPATQRPAASESHAESAEGAELDSHAESAETAEPEFHAESAETAENESHAESAETAENESHAESAETAENESHAESAENAEEEIPAAFAGDPENAKAFLAARKLARLSPEQAKAMLDDANRARKEGDAVQAASLEVDRLTRSRRLGEALAAASNRVETVRAARAKGEEPDPMAEAVAFNDYAWVLHLAGRDAEALPLGRRAVERVAVASGESWLAGADGGAALDTLACVLTALGETDEAKERFAAAFESADSCTAPEWDSLMRARRAVGRKTRQFHLAQCWDRAGETAPAKAILDALRAEGFVPPPPEDAAYDALAEKLGAAPLPPGARERAALDILVDLVAGVFFESECREPDDRTDPAMVPLLERVAADLAALPADGAPDEVRAALDGLRLFVEDCAARVAERPDALPAAGEFQTRLKAFGRAAKAAGARTAPLLDLVR